MKIFNYFKQLFNANKHKELSDKILEQERLLQLYERKNAELNEIIKTKSFLLDRYTRKR